jgi:FO synthase
VVAARLAELGHADFTAYVVWVCERALERGLLPHTNLGVLRSSPACARSPPPRG